MSVDVFEQARRSVSSSLIERMFPGGSWQGKDYWLLSPLREDKTPGSFHIKDDGRWYDHATSEGGDLIDLVARSAGCAKSAAAERIVREAGGASTLPAAPPTRMEKPQAVIPVPQEARESFRQARDNDYTRKHLGKLSGTWPYKRADGGTAFLVCRYEPRAGEKTIRPWYCGTDGKWHEGQALDTSRPLFRLPEVLASTLPVLIVEGEKCATLRAPGDSPFIVTTWAGGAAAVGKTDWAPLKDRPVVIWPDTEEPGTKAALEIKRQLLRARVLRIEGKPQGWDMVDAAAEGVDLARFVAECPEETGSSPEKREGFLAVPVSSIERKELRWLWLGRIPLGKLTVIAGDPGLGKSLLTLYIAAGVSMGEVFTDGTRPPAGSALLISAEDDAADTIRPRLEAAEADLSRVFVHLAVRRGGKTGTFSLEDDLEMLSQRLAEMNRPVLIVIDPLSAYLGGTDSHKNSDVRGILAPLSALAAKHGVAVLAVHHLNKGSGPAIYRLSGSLAFAAARAVLGVCRDPDDEKARLLVSIKCNLSQECDGLRFSVVEGPKIEWGETVSGKDVDRLLGHEDPKSGRNPRRPRTGYRRGSRRVRYRLGTY